MSCDPEDYLQLRGNMATMAQKAKDQVRAPGGRVAFHFNGARGLFRGTVTQVADWGVRVGLDKSSFNVPVEWDHLVWWGPS